MTATRVAFIGAGFIASRHAESLAVLDGVQIAAVADPRPNGTRPSQPGPELVPRGSIWPSTKMASVREAGLSVPKVS